MVGNTRDGVEGVFDHGLSILNHEPSDKQYSTIVRTNQWARTVSYPPPMKKFIQSTLTSPPVCVTSSVYLYDSTALEAEGLEVSSGHNNNIFSLLLSFSSSLLSELYVRGPTFAIFFFLSYETLIIHTFTRSFFSFAIVFDFVLSCLRRDY